ncbi:MAG: ATP-binding protein [Spirochaetota bacterium]|nr:ATP-binding protein [Spirochaetota bacterium]
MEKWKNNSLNDFDLLNFSRNLTSTHDLDAILKTISNETTSLLNADRCTLYVYDSIKEELWSKIAQGLEIDEIRLKIGVGIAGQVADMKTVINIEDAYDTAYFNPKIDELTGYLTKTLLVSPLLNISGELVGVIEVLNKIDGVFTQRDEEFIQIISNISAIAIEQAQLYEWNKVLRKYNENIINNISSGLIVIDPEYRITVINKVAEEIFSAFTDKLKGNIITDKLSFFIQLPNLLKSLTQNDSTKLENVNVSHNNISKYLNVKGSKLISDIDTDYGYILLVDDITEKVLLEQEKKQIESLTLIGNMTSSIIHDIKNPLSIIKAYLQIMDKNNNNEKFKRYYSVIYNEIDRLVSMTGEVLHFARGEYGVNLETCKIIDFIYDVAPLIKQLFREKNIKLKILMQYQGEVLIDKDKIRRLFYNIASNANDAMNDESGIFEIKVAKVGNILKLAFKDNGKGIPANIVENIFAPFTTHNKRTGIGLGMSIVKKIVDEHKGNIEVNSVENEGTEIIVSIPLISI